MKLNFKEDPKAWRKSALVTVLGLAMISSLLRWRHTLNNRTWLIILTALVLLAMAALLRPRWCRGWYRFSLWLGFYCSQFIGRGVLALLFILILTPLGFVLRLAGKDALQLKRPRDAKTHWHQARSSSPLDRLF